MIAKLASVVAASAFVLAILALGAAPADAQVANRRFPFPLPGTGTFSGHVMARTFRPPPPRDPNDTRIGMPNPWINLPVAGATIEVTWALLYANNANTAQSAQLSRRFPVRGWTATSGADGSFSLSGLPQGPFQYRVMHPDYAETSGNFSMGRWGGVQQDILLKGRADSLGSFSGRVTAMPRWKFLPLAANAIAPTGAAASDASADPAAKDDGAGATEALDGGEAAADKLTEPPPGATPPDPATANATPVAASSNAVAPGSNSFIRPIWLGNGIANCTVVVNAAPMIYYANGASGGAAPAGGTNSFVQPYPGPRSWTTQTDFNGNFGVKGLPSGRYTYRVTNRYFQPKGGSFWVGESEAQVYRTIQLERRVRGTFAGVVGEGPRILVPGPFPYAQPDSSLAGATPASQILPFRFTPLAGARVLVMRSRFLFPAPPPWRVPGEIPLAATPNAATPTSGAATSDGRAIVNADGGEEAQLLKAAQDGTAAADAPPADDGANDAAIADAQAAADGSDDKAATPAAAGGAAQAIAPNSLVAPSAINIPFWMVGSTTNTAGRFSISRLPAGSYLFAVVAADHRPQIGRFSISMTTPRVFRRILLPSNGGVIDQAGLSGTVLGYGSGGFLPPVVYKGGVQAQPAQPSTQAQAIFPLAGATVNAFQVALPGELVPQIVRTATTDAQGHFSFGALSGRFVISVEAQGYFGTKQEVYAGPGTAPVTVYLRPASVYATPLKATDAPPVTGSNVDNPFTEAK